MSDTAENSQAKIDSFESAMAELNRLVDQLENGELPLEQSITVYQRGVELVRYCAKQLEKVDRQIEVLDKEMLKPFQQDESIDNR